MILSALSHLWMTLIDTWRSILEILHPIVADSWICIYIWERVDGKRYQLLSIKRSLIHHQKNKKTSLHPYVRIDFQTKFFTHWVNETMREQRGKKIMSQKTFPFKYEENRRDRGITSLGGLPLYLGLANVIGLSESVKEHIRIRENKYEIRNSL